MNDPVKLADIEAKIGGHAVTLTTPGLPLPVPIVAPEKAAAPVGTSANDPTQNLNDGRYAAAFALAARASDEQFGTLMKKVVDDDAERAQRPIDALVMGELRLVAGEVDSAVEAIRAAIAKGDAPPFMYKSLGWSLLAQGKPDAAKHAFELVLKKRRISDGTFNLEAAGPDEMTAAYFLNAVDQDHYVSNFDKNEKLACYPWFYVGQRREVEGDKTSAIAAYKHCVELAASDTPHSVRALARWRLGKLAETLGNGQKK